MTLDQHSNGNARNAAEADDASAATLGAALVDALADGGGGLSDEEVEARIRDFYQENFETLRLEGGHVLSPEVLEAGLLQVLLYWRKLHDVAEKVTETEVKLNLPDQKTMEGRTFGIEGVVDIVREDNDGAQRVTMYDLKTHDADFVRANVQDYAGQLNVYAYIWQNLRGQQLDETAIISTVVPFALREAVNTGQEARAAHEMGKWQPIIPIPFDQNGVQTMIEDFARTVDCIENHEFAPPPVEVLKAKRPGQRQTFATNVCLNCDARFSCSSYRAYALKSGTAAERTFRQYFHEVQTDSEHDDWLTAGLQHTESRELEELE